MSEHVVTTGSTTAPAAGTGTHRLARVTAVMLPVLLTALFAGGCDELTERVEEPRGGGVAADGTALALLDTIEVREDKPSEPYERDAFGTSWLDVDDNGCDTRNDILHRDLASITVRRTDECIVMSGELLDPYTERTIRFNRERNASGVQIDHVIALADAWRTGAAEWTDEEREQFANDPENLLAVEGSVNQDKSDGDAAEWLPPAPEAHCPYVARQVGLKVRYGLWVEPAEAAAMRSVLETCPDQPPLGIVPAGG